MKPIQVFVTEEEHKELKHIALEKGISLSALIRLYLEVKKEVREPSAPEPAKTPTESRPENKNRPYAELPIEETGKLQAKVDEGWQGPLMRNPKKGKL